MGFLQFLPSILQAISAVERFVKTRGKQKQEAAIDLIRDGLIAAEDITDRDLLDDPEVEKATRHLIDEIVTFRNIVAKVKVKRQRVPAPVPVDD